MVKKTLTTLGILACGAMLGALMVAGISPRSEPKLAYPPHGLPETLKETPEGRASLNVLQEVLEYIGSNYVREVADKEAVELMVRGLTEIDPHTHFETPEEARQNRDTMVSGSFGGVGMTLSKSQNTERPGIVVVSALDDTPAHRKGIRAKDMIIKVNGEFIGTMKLQEVINLVRGAVGEPVTLTIFREGTPEPFDVTLVREVINIQLVKHELKPDGVGYVRIAQFAEPVCSRTSSVNKVGQAVRSLTEQNKKPLTGLVLDLRNNPGGFLHAADCVTNQFLAGSQYRNRDEATTISSESRGERRTIAGVYSRTDILGGKPLLILVDGGSASASEIVAGVLQMHGRAIVAGIEKTFGKGTLQTLLPITGGGTLRLTTGQYLIGPKGCERAVQGIGITPDILLKRGAKDPPASLELRERALPRSIGTAQQRQEECRYSFAVPESHKAAAYKMLKIMELEPLDAPSQ